MNELIFIRKQVAFIHDLLDSALNGIDEQQLNWSPPGTITPISSVLLHVIHSEDIFISVIQSSPTCWEGQGWSARLHVTDLPKMGGDWNAFRTMVMPLAPLLEYLQAVQSLTKSCLETLAAADLDCQVTLDGSTMSIADILVILIGHCAHHAGEIASLRGIQGAQGLPF